MDLNMLTEILTSGVAFAIPLLLAATGEAISERAGVLNLSMEGMMLTGAFASVLGSVSTGSAMLGAVTGVVAGLVFGVFQALLSVRLRADQIVVGVAANALALGLTTFGARILLGDGRGTTYRRSPTSASRYSANCRSSGPHCSARHCSGTSAWRRSPRWRWSSRRGR